MEIHEIKRFASISSINESFVVTASNYSYSHPLTFEVLNIV